MAYMVFKLVEAKLALTEEKKIKLEQIFAAARGLHNHYVTKYQNSSDTEIRRQAEATHKFPFGCREDVAVMHLGEEINPATFESMTQIVCNTWCEFVEGKRPRPMFKMPRHIQAFWVLDSRQISTTKRSITIPGLIPLEIDLPEGTFSGNPSAIKISRDKNDDYFIAGLYEQVSQKPVDDPLMTMVGIRLFAALTNYHRAKSAFRKNAAVKTSDDYKQSRTELSIARMTAIAIMLKRNKQAKKEMEGETIQAATV